MEILSEAHFWVGVALVIFLGVLAWAGVPAMALKALDARGQKVQAQLDEANQLRQEAQDLLVQVKVQREQSETLAAEILANAREDAKRLAVESQAKLEEQIERRSQLAEQRIAVAEAQAAAQVKAAAGELAAQMAETVLTQRLTGATSDPLIDSAIGQLASKLQ